MMTTGLDIKFDKKNFDRLYINGYDTRISCDCFDGNSAYFEIVRQCPAILHGDREVVSLGFYIIRDGDFGTVKTVLINESGKDVPISVNEFGKTAKAFGHVDEEIVDTLCLIFTSEEGQTIFANTFFAGY